VNLSMLRLCNIRRILRSDVFISATPGSGCALYRNEQLVGFIKYVLALNL
jgi:hypothetical protein